MRKFSKKFRKNFYLLIVAIFVMCLAGYLFFLNSKSYEQRLIQKSYDYLEHYKSFQLSDVEVTLNDDIYFVKWGNIKQAFQFPKELETLDDSKFITSEITDKQIIKVYENSKNIIEHFIEKSSTIKFEDKEPLIAKINNLPIKNVDNPEDFELNNVGALFINETIYIVDKENVCEWMLCHELIHYIRYTLSGENIEYLPSNFDEIMTDLITSALQPDLSRNIISAYSINYDYLLLYISVFHEDAFIDFFYGYNEDSGVWKLTSKTEHDFFVNALQFIDENPDFSSIAVSQIIRWHIEILNNPDKKIAIIAIFLFHKSILILHLAL